MKKFIIPVLLVIIIGGAFCQEEIDPLPVYYTYSEFLLAPPGQMDIGLYGFINPAVLAHVNGFDTLVVLSGEDPSFLPVTQWGLFGVLPGIGLGTINTLVTDDIWLTNSRISVGFGTDELSAGLGYEWSTLDGESLDDAALLTYGILSRPIPYISLGISGNVNLSWDEYEVAIELGLRPLGNSVLTLFSDYAFTTCQEWEDILEGEMSVGLTARLPFLEGLYATGRYFPLSSHFSAGLKFSTGPMAATYQAHFDKDINFTHYTSGLRSGQSEPTLFEEILKDNFYLVLELFGYIDYQVRSLFFKPHTLLEILGNIQSAKTNPIIKGIVINTSGMYADREKIWEIREALKDFKSAGKKVVIYLEGANIDYYYFASIADKIVCDPLSMISLDGYMMGMSYYKGLLEKAGIGFEELRILKYKSYYESFSRDSMSEAEKEQSLEYINDLYDITKKEVCESRNISDSDYEKFVNEISLFNAREALDRKLIDGIARFNDIQEEVNGLEGREMYLIGPGALPERNRPFSNEWGAKKRIAVIYALGLCDLDSGMATRQLADDIERASSDFSIKAVVIRVDSPGGSALAGDFMADAIKRCRKIKPVIISQGFIAASAGYWISMYGDVIVAAPQTLSGSIGVAGGWFYDNGLKEKLGISTDYVKKGEFADFGFGFTVPYIYMSLPDRNMNADERTMLEKYMAGTYDDFIKKVAEGRHKSEGEIEEVAQGRIWSGLKAKEKGLVDEIGGLMRAINIAKEKADIPAKEKIIIAEYPEFNFSSVYGPFFSSIGLSVPYRNNTATTYTPFDILQYRINHNGMPLPIIDMYNLGLLGPYFALQKSLGEVSGSPFK